MNWVFSQMKPKSLSYKTPIIYISQEKITILNSMSNYLSEIYGYPQNSRI